MQLTTFPQRELTRGLQAVPAVLTHLTSTDTWLFQIAVSNTTAGTLQLTVQDRQGTPKKLLNAIDIDPGPPYFFSMDELGVKFTSGLSWQASGSGLIAEVVGVYNG